MQSIASMREYINEYVRSHSIEVTGPVLLKEYFGIPFQNIKEEYYINNIPMSYEEAMNYIKGFFESLDTTAIIELYNKIKI
jgi:hypothetical protein